MLRKLAKLAIRNKLLVVIIFLSLALRLYNLSGTPPSLNWDEISHGFNAYSLLKSGKDEWGKTFPIIFRAYGDYKLPVYIYLTAFSEFVFGLNSFSVRFVSALAGVGIVFFSYLLGTKLFNKQIGILTAFLVAVEPWTLFLSRGAFEANLASFFIVSGVYFFVVGIESVSKLILSAVFLALSIWTYNSARVFVPIVLLFLLFTYSGEIKELLASRLKKLYLIGAALLFACFFLPMTVQILLPEGQARYSKVSIIDAGAIEYINSLRNSYDFPVLFEKLVFNRPIYFLTSVAANLFSHLSPYFLFLKGGSHYQFNVQDHGLIYLINAPFLVYGLYLLIQELFKKRSLKSKLVVGWFVLGLVPSSLTREAPHALRSITVFPLPMLMTAYGLYGAYVKLGSYKKIAITSYLVLIILSVGAYLSNYFQRYRTEYSWAWQYGYEEVVDFVRANYARYDKIIMTKKYGEPHEFILFYWPWDPVGYRSDSNLVRFYQTGWYWVDKFDKFYFVNDWQIPQNATDKWILESGSEIEITGSTLLITSPGNAPKDWKRLGKILFLDGTTAFELYEYKN